ncbi:ATP-binding cassette domain-containing protein [Nocardioides panaciterrulae]|uniref:ABC-type multidrug transport system ATPase subunit n=1 Tax=Nocardioides panaciterrulae TaxID=661492 RepID=A0A7Y9JBR5_9ACTN|nr:ATP-binding cassette domain-containing protein [Nocardioides panaciterrulae]NYD42638.1 ABC-type multidrug transport system ATPase subunit [Nocardioides panaciterrulae]
MTLDNAIEAEGLSKSYGNLRAVDSFTLEVPQGVVLGFLGPNGAGKTTVIRMLATLIEQDTGTFSVAGVPGSRPAELRRKVGVLAESAGYPEGQSGRTWLTYHAELFGHRRVAAEGGRGRQASRRCGSERARAWRRGSVRSVVPAEEDPARGRHEGACRSWSSPRRTRGSWSDG